MTSPNTCTDNTERESEKQQNEDQEQIKSLEERISSLERQLISITGLIEQIILMAKSVSLEEESHEFPDYLYG